METQKTSSNASRNTSRLLAAVLVMQGLVLMGQWTGQPGAPAPAMAQALDPGAQRLAQTEELRGINARLDKIIDLLSRGEIQVKVQTADDKRAGPQAR